MSSLNGRELKMRQIIKELFVANPRGAELLEIWVEDYIVNAPTWAPNAPEGYGYFREGQNSVIRQILDVVNTNQLENDT